jgi:hypothetical protein
MDIEAKGKTVQVRCWCKRQPLLAVGGRDTKNRPFLQVKTIKSGQISVHVIIHEGSLSIQCRECLRWHKVNILATKLTREKIDRLEPAVAQSEVLLRVT